MPEKNLLTETEINERRKAAEYALNTVRNEGFEFTQEELDEINLVAEGIMSVDEYEKEIWDKVERWKKEHPEWFYHG
jgi:hypothetical protein